MAKKQPVCDEQCFTCEFPDCIWDGYETAIKKSGYRDDYYARNREKILARKRQQYQAKKLKSGPGGESQREGRIYFEHA